MLVVIKLYLFTMLILLSPHIKANPSLKAALEMEEKIQKIAQESISKCVLIGGGTGVFISPYDILTNEHIVRGSDEWEVSVYSGEILEGQVIGRDIQGDLALLRVKSSVDVSYFSLGDSDRLRAGEWVIAVGNAFLLAKDVKSMAVSLGIVSATNRNQERYHNLIQTDVALNPGNSGGPLVNLKGELVGLNSLITSRFQDRQNSGVSYAISSRQIKSFLPLLQRQKQRQKGKRKIFHGTIAGVKLLDLENKEGVFIEKTSLVQKKLQSGDIIWDIDGFPVYNTKQLQGRLWLYPAFCEVHCKILRGGKKKEVTLKLVPFYN